MNDGMRIEVYIAVSLDGYISDPTGDFHWLDAYGDPNDYGYEAFYAGVDALVMGRTTYDQVAAFPEWPYAGRPCFVLSHRPPAAPPPEAVRFVHGDIGDLVSQIRETGARRVWHVGGGKSIAAFLNAGAIDAWRIFVMPYLLGDGIRLFPEHTGAGPLRLLESHAYPNGVVEVRYAGAAG
jgi:dihydrofolate reductase